MDSILDHVRWNKYKLPAGATTGEIDLAIGTVGEGKPTGLLIAGLHGDEGPWGAWAIRKTLEKIRPNELRGSLRIIPASNPSGVEVGKRNAALDLIPMDLNRSFPGDESGLHTERTAALIARYGVAGVDAVVDVHGGGNWCVNAFVARFPGSEELANSVGAPFVMDRQPIPNTLTGYATGLGAKVTLLEMGGIGSEEEAWANRVSSGIERALNAAGIIDTENKTPKSKSIAVGPSKVVRPSKGGVYLPVMKEKDVGTVVKGDTVTGHLLDPVTMGVVETFKAPYPETAMLLLRPGLIQVEGATVLQIVAQPK
jgi:predicted deacylase